MEQHPHFVLLWTFYLTGVALSILMAAATTVQDKLNSITNYQEYFRHYAIAIVARVFLVICNYPFLWDNPSAFDIEGTFHNFGLQLGASGAIGFFCDTFFDRVAKLLGISGRLPALPGAPTQPPGAKP